MVMNTVINTSTQQPTDTRKYSIYYQELSKETKRRYEKLDILHLKADPYTFSHEEWSSDISLWPEVEYPDIYN